MESPYNPLDKLNLGRSVAEALLLRPVTPLTETTELAGAGVYAIYYIGSFSPYQPVAQKNRDEEFSQPIYVGKAVPKGARKGGLAFDAAKGKALRDRLRQHASSIDEAINLDVTDFRYRSLVVDDIWIPLGENMMIEQFKPIWNLVVDGFGNKDPGMRRAAQYKSPWDVLHPGRKFAEKLADGGLTAEALSTRLAEYFAGQAVPLVPTEEAGDIGTAEGEED
ncbi:Eco29kI family restriction endonuclease [Silvibacterium acidisoli]|uniref:Eco29kI family restriction endonuclease n=1 Tax=Acidobacteriaceae bacterium ZG23-2 TaxID=2883246 RepID=UPI00406D1A42